MIPPSSLARLVLGYLEEEGLQRTKQVFQEECNDAIEDPFTQYSSLKSILEEYVELKESARQPNNDPGLVISSLWKKLDVVIGQLKYHTIPTTKVPRVKTHRTKRSTVCGRLQIAKPVSSHTNIPLNSSTYKNSSKNTQEFLTISNENNLGIYPSGPVNESGDDLSRVPPLYSESGKQQMLTPTTISTSGINVSIVSPVLQQSENLLLSYKSQGNVVSSGSNLSNTLPMQEQSLHVQNITSSYPHFGKEFRQDALSRVPQVHEDLCNKHSITGTCSVLTSSSSGPLVCTCLDSYNQSSNVVTPNSECSSAASIEVMEEKSTSLLTCGSDVTSCHRANPLDRGLSHVSDNVGEQSSVDRIEILSKSPKRKGHTPKKRNFCNPSPTKLFPVDSNPGTFHSSETIDLQQLLDGGNVDIDAAMPLLLDTFLSTPLLQEKLAENINKVVGGSKQNESEPEVVLETSQELSSKEDTSSSHQDEPQVPVDDILNLMEADPAFEALFGLLSTGEATNTDGVKMASPAKASQAVTTCSYTEPISTGSTTSNVHSSTVSTGSASSTLHSSSSNDLSATSVVTESLLLLARSPSKFPTPTSVTNSVESSPIISPKELTPETMNKQHKDSPLNTSCKDGVSASGLSSLVHVRSLQFQEEITTASAEKHKRAKPGRQKRNSSKTTSSKSGTLKSKHSKTGIGEGGVKWKQKPLTPRSSRAVSEGMGNIPGSVTGQFAFPAQKGPNIATNIDVSAIKLLQSFSCLQTNADGSNGNGMGIKKPQGNTMLQLLQDAAIHQQGQAAASGGCESQQIYQDPLKGPSLSSLTSLHAQGIVPKKPFMTVSNDSIKPAPLLKNLLSAPKSTAQVNGSKEMKQTTSLRQISPIPLSNQQGEIQKLLVCPASKTCSSIESQSCSTPLQSTLVQPLQKHSSVQSVSTPQLSLSASCGSSSSSSSSSSFVSSSSLVQSLCAVSAETMVSSTLPLSSSTSTPLSSLQSLASSVSSTSLPQTYLQSLLSSTSTPSYLRSLPSSVSSTSTSSSSSSSYLKSLLSSSVSSSSSSSLSSSSLSSSSSSSSSSSMAHVLSSFPSSRLQIKDSNLPISVNQTFANLSSTQQHIQPNSIYTPATTIQSTVLPNSSTRKNIINESKNQTKQNSQGITTLEKPPSSVVMTTAELQGKQIPVRLDSNESSPTSQNAEECVSGFISGFESFLGDIQPCSNQETCTVPGNNMVSEKLIKTSKDKDLDCSSQKSSIMENIYSNKEVKKKSNTSTNLDKNVCNGSNFSDQEINEERREVKHSDGRMSCTEDRIAMRQAQKRPADQDLKENKPKKSKGSKKKSKTKALPKNFDVEKFLSKLHYVEK